MAFWIKYRPSRWGELLPNNFLRPLIKFIYNKEGKKYVFITALIFGLIFVGVIPTLNFIWSNIFKVWLFVLVIPMFYWTLAITSVYMRVILKAFSEFVMVIRKKFFIDNEIHLK